MSTCLGLDGATGISTRRTCAVQTVLMSTSLPVAGGCWSSGGDLDRRHSEAKRPSPQANRPACGQRAAQGRMIWEWPGPHGGSWNALAGRASEEGAETQASDLWSRNHAAVACLQDTQITFYQCSRNYSHNSCLVFRQKNRVPGFFLSCFNLLKCFHFPRNGRQVS